jgi:TRAP-type C4-dicarboxylate transport system permease small subunit
MQIAISRKSQRLVGFYQKIMFFANAFTCLSAFIAMILVVLDVVGRSVFGAPVPGTLEITQLILVMIIYLPMASLELKREQLRITVLQGVLLEWQRKAMDIFSRIVSTCTFGFLAGLTLASAIHSYELHEASWGAVSIPLWIPKATISIGCILAFLSNLLVLLSHHNQKGARA